MNPSLDDRNFHFLSFRSYLAMSTDRLFVPDLARQYQKYTSRDFVGLAQLKSTHAKQISDFRLWASKHDWIQFHENHYDWWTFPINDKSSFGLAYTVFKYETDTLQTDPEFMSNFREGLRLIALSWAWNLTTREEIPEIQRDRHQQWYIICIILLLAIVVSLFDTAMFLLLCDDITVGAIGGCDSTRRVDPRIFSTALRRGTH